MPGLLPDGEVLQRYYTAISTDENRNQRKQAVCLPVMSPTMVRAALCQYQAANTYHCSKGFQQGKRRQQWVGPSAGSSPLQVAATDALQAVACFQGGNPAWRTFVGVRCAGCTLSRYSRV